MDLRQGEESVFSAGSIVADRYEIVNQLGAGSMGIVLRAIDRSLDNEPVALKLLYPHLVADKTVFARFRNEVLVARKLSHPNIVRLYDFGKASRGYYFISMEFVAGYSLKDRIYGRRFEPLTFEEAVRILYEVGLGVAHAHRNGVIHRDLKPDNILISERGDVKVTDFGLARQTQVDKGFTQSGETVGTPCYMAPEQIRGEQLDARADIYSLGIMAYEMVTTEKPFDDDNWLTLATMHMTEPLPRFPKELEIPSWFEDFVQRSAEKNREDRFQSAEEWAEELRRHMEGDRTKIYAPAVLSDLMAKVARSRHSHRRNRRLLKQSALGVVIAALCVILPVLVVRQIPSFQHAVLRSLATIEKATGASLRGIKGAFGVDVELTVEELSRSIAAKDSRIVGMLLAAGVKGDARDASGEPLLHSAVRSGALGSVTPFLSSGVKVDERDSTNSTPLMFAAELEDSSILEALIKAGASINTVNNSAMNAVMFASRAGREGNLQLLLRAQGDVNASDKDGVSTLVHAIRSASLIAVQTLVDAGARVRTADARGWTPLMFAAQTGNVPIVEFLLSRGADADTKNVEGKTVRDLATVETRKAIVAYQRTSSERTPPTTRAVVTINGSNAGQKITESVATLTRLRLLSAPEGRWLTGKLTKLLGVTASVKNFGEVPAQDVEVVAKIPGGNELTLKGPQSIAPNSSERFEVEVPEPMQLVSQAGSIEVTIRCKNCYR